MGVFEGYQSAWLTAQVAASVCVVLLVGAVLTLAPYAFASSRPKSFPPGPPTKPFLGNLHLLPPSKSFTVYVLCCGRSIKAESLATATNLWVSGSASG